MSEFKRTAKMFLEDAKKDLAEGRYASCVVHAHMAVEHSLKSYLLRSGISVRFRAFSEVAREARRLNVIDEDGLRDLLNVNTFRNRIYHEGYMPTRPEVEAVLTTAKRCVSLLTP